MADPDYFTVAEFQADMPDCSDFTEAEILAAAAHFTTIVEREVFGEDGGGFVPRAVTTAIDGPGGSLLILPHANVSTITSITVGGVTVDPDDLSCRNGMVRYLVPTNGWTCGIDNIEVTYTVGKYAECPADVKSAVMWATRDRLISQSAEHTQDPRQSSMTNDLGGTVTYVLPGEKRPTGYPELDALIASYQRSASVYGMA